MQAAVNKTLLEVVAQFATGLYPVPESVIMKRSGQKLDFMQVARTIAELAIAEQIFFPFQGTAVIPPRAGWRYMPEISRILRNNLRPHPGY
jgi:hypothetical protein